MKPPVQKKAEGEKIVLDRENQKVIYNGIAYPPTGHNLQVVREYRRTGDEEVLKNRLSTVSLDI